MMRLLPQSLFSRIVLILLGGLIRENPPFDVLPSGGAFPMPSRLLLNLPILLAAVILLSLLAVRLATRPLNILASAAEKP